MIGAIWRGFLDFFKAIWEVVTEPQFLEMLVIVFFLLFVGTVFYCNAENWSILDSFYFCVSTLTTVGYGDLAPTTDASKIFTSFYILTGVGVLLGFVNAVAVNAKDKSPLDRFFKK